MFFSRRSHSHTRRSWKRGLRLLLAPKWPARASHWISRFLRKAERTLVRLVTPVWLRRTGRRVQKGLKRAETSVARAGHTVSETVANSAVGSGAKQMARRGRVLEFIAFKYFVDALSSLVAAVVPKPVRDFFQVIGRFFCRAFGVLFVFLGRWFRTRSYWHLLGGLPAFVMALPLAFFLVRMPVNNVAAKARHYRTAAQEALQNKEYRIAHLYYRKLNQLGAMNEVAEYQAAINEYQSGDRPQAIARMKRLAPESEPGFAAAHLWLARLHLSGDSDADEEKQTELAELHLNHALDHDPGNPEARALRALHFQRTGRWDDALIELRQVVNRLPNQGLNLAQIYARQGHWQAARREVGKVLQLYEEKERQEAELTPVEYLIWADANIIVGERAKTEQVLEAGLARHPEHDGLIRRLHRFCINSAAMFEARRTNDRDQIKYLSRAWELRQDDNDPLIRLTTLAQANGETGQLARDAIASLMTSDSPPEILFAIAGAIAAEHGNYQQAVDYLRQACQASPQDAQSLNNLAWVLLQMGDAYLGEALERSTQALTTQPDEAMYRETRGQILVRLGRYEEGIRELEYALNGLSDVAEIHQSLANAYEKLGRLESARAHRARAGRSFSD